MKLGVLVPSADYMTYAGARIRYGRVAPFMKQTGNELELIEIGDFDPDRSRHDAVLISKCHDVRSLVAAAACARRGKHIGVDLFDDYFSDFTDSRLVRYRNWLSQMTVMCDFALCSTASMRETVKSYRCDLPVHILNDPAPEVDLEHLGTVLEDKVTRANEDRTIRIVWYGVGDNAYFEAGLSDLSARGDELAMLSTSGFAIDLTVLTNARALTAKALALIARLPVSARIVEWSQDAERAALEKSLIAFLPVNASSFSSAKSLNRALSALSAGCQVLSAGYPLYEILGTLVYDSPNPLIKDIQLGQMRFSRDRVPEYHDLLRRIGKAEIEAERLGLFLDSLSSPRVRHEETLTLVHGRSANLEAHEKVQAAGGLSVSSPFNAAPIPFDIIFKGSGKRLHMLVAKSVLGRLLPEALSRVRAVKHEKSSHYFLLEPIDESFSQAEPERAGMSLAMQMATYKETMSAMQVQLAAAVGPIQMIMLESSRIPFPMPSVPK